MDRERNLAAFLAGNHPDVPRVMYHGTKYGNIDKFKGYRGSAGHFAFTPKEASGYAGGHDEVPHDDEYFHEEGPQVYPVHIIAKNVFDARNPDHVKKIGVNPRGNWDYEDLEHSLSAMKKGGFDSYFDFEYGISQMQNDGSRKINEPTGIAVFHPHQIKSATGNRGTFDPSDLDITKGDGGEVDGITAYHGSPHEFERFDTSKIGTGEGAQAYGHGLYFAESEPVAKSYRDTLSPALEKNRGSNWVRYAENHFGSRDKAPEIFKAMAESHGLDPNEVKETLKDIQAAKGHMYEVHIDAHPDHFLDWDKPLSEQHPNVQKFLSKVFNPPKEDQSIGDWLKPRLGEGMAEYWSEDMHKAGIPGIKYLDAGSRGPTDQPTHNYVVFDHDRVNIKRRYAEGGEVEREGFGFGGDTEFAGSRPERGATGSVSVERSAPSREISSQSDTKVDTQSDRRGGGDSADIMGFRNLDFSSGAENPAVKKIESAFPTKISGFEGAPPIGMPTSLKDLQDFTIQKERDDHAVAPGLKTYSFFNPNTKPMADISSLTANKNPITGTGESVAFTGTTQDRPFMTASQAAQQQLQKAYAPTPDTGALAEYFQDPSSIGAQNIAANSSIYSPTVEFNTKFDPVTQGFVRTTEPQTVPNVGMGMAGRISPESTIPNVGMGMPGRIGPEPTIPNVGMGMAGRIGPGPTIPNVGMGMPGRTGPEPTTPNIAMGMPGRISPASTTPQQDTVVASTPSDAGQQDALTLPGQKLFTRQPGPPMPPIPDRDLGAGNLFDQILKPFGMDTASWLDNKSSEYIKQGMLPSDAYTKASYDLNDLQKNLKNRSSDGRKMVLKLMPDGTYQYVWEEYKRGGVAKYRAPYHNHGIVEHALAKISAPPPALNDPLTVAKRGRPL